MTQPTGHDGVATGPGMIARSGRLLCIVMILLCAFVCTCPALLPTDVQPLDAIEEAYLDGRYREVIDLATDVLRQLPHLHDARFLRGAARWRLGNRAQARRDLLAYLESGGDFAGEARDLLAETARERATGLLYGYRVGAIYSDRVVRPDLFLDDPRRETEGLGIRFGWNVETVSGGVLGLQFQGTHLQYPDVPEASWHHEAVDAVARWYTPSRTALLEWRVGGEFVRRDSDPDVFRARTRVEGTWAVVPHRHIAWLAFEAADDNYPYDREFNGPPILFAGGVDHYAGDFSFTWDAYLLSHNARNDALSFTESGGRVGLGWTPGDRIHVGASVRTLVAEFDRYNRIFESDRTDDYVSADAWLTCELNERWSLTPFVEYTHNDSSFSDIDFDRFIFGLDLVFGVL